LQIFLGRSDLKEDQKEFEKEEESSKTSSIADSILNKHTRNFQFNPSSTLITKSPNQLQFNINNNLEKNSVKLNNNSSDEIKANETKYKKWKFMGKKRNLHKLNNQSNLIYPECLNEKLIDNQQENQLINQINNSKRVIINSNNQNSSKFKNSTNLNSNLNLPTVQITSTNNKLLNPLTLYQMYNQNEINFRSNNPTPTDFLSNIEQFKTIQQSNGQLDERHSFSSSFSRQYVCCNLFDDNIRQIDFVIVYDSILHEYGKKFINKSISSSVSLNKDQFSQINKSNENLSNQEDKISEENEKRNKFKLKKLNLDKSENSDELKKDDESNGDDELNTEIRRLSTSDFNELDKIEELDNNHDEEIEYLETKIIDMMNQKTPLDKEERKKFKKFKKQLTISKNDNENENENVFENDSNENSSNDNLNEIFNQTLNSKLNRNEIQLNSRQRYLTECCKRFEENLIAEGLELEFTEAQFVNTNNRRIGFLKVHCPWNILTKYAELMKLKMPLKQIETSWRVVFDEKNDPYSKGRFTAPYSKGKLNLLINTFD
jgi:hypothetical protein